MQQQTPEVKTQRVATNTVGGEDLPRTIFNTLKKTLNLRQAETIDFVWMHEDAFDEGFNIANNVIVGVTSLRVFKIEKAALSQLMLASIGSVVHQKNGVFRWDKIECRLKNGKQETFGVYHGEACKFLCNYVAGKLVETPAKKQDDTPPAIWSDAM